MTMITNRFDLSDVRTPAEISDGIPVSIEAETAGGISTEITAPWSRPSSVSDRADWTNLDGDATQNTPRRR